MPEGQMPPAAAGAGAPPADPSSAQPPQGASPGDLPGAVNQIGQMMDQLVQSLSDSGAPPSVQKAFATAMSAFQEAADEMGEPSGDEDDSGASTPEQGASGAVPMSHQSMKGG